MIHKTKDLTDKINIIVLELESENRNLRRENSLLQQQIKGNEREHQTPINVLKLSGRAANCLIRCDIKTIEELAQMSIVDLRRVRNIGELTLKEINEKAKAYGLKGWQ